jgi:hypothetical protein
VKRVNWMAVVAGVFGVIAVVSSVLGYLTEDWLLIAHAGVLTLVGLIATGLSFRSDA